MGSLMLVPVSDLDEAKAVRFVPLNKASAREVIQEGIYIAIVVRKGQNLNPFRPVLKASFPVRDHPETYV